MFCSNCGNELRQNLKYCNRCGAITAAELEKTVASSESGKTVQALSIVIGWVGVAGIVALAILIGNLLRKDHIEFSAFMLVVVFSIMIFAVVYLIVRQISLLSGKGFLPAAKEGVLQARQNLPRTENAPQLEQPKVPVGSVTDHTTRIFEETFAEKPKT
jgi:hypothetical protein